MQFDGNGVATALVPQPRPQRLLEWLAGASPQAAQRRENPGQEIVEGFGVCTDDQLGEMVLSPIEVAAL